MKPTLCLFTLGVSDMDVAKSFYTALGWNDITPDYAKGKIVFLGGDAGPPMALWPRDLLAADSGVPEDPGGWGGITLAYNVAQKAEVDSVIETARRNGAEIVREAGATEWGGYSGVFADTDGHRWEIAFPLLTTLLT